MRNEDKHVCVVRRVVLRVVGQNGDMCLIMWAQHRRWVMLVRDENEDVCAVRRVVLRVVGKSGD